jgi:hypothetical protein
MRSSVLIGGKSDDHERHDMDFYPTPPECTHALLQFLKLDRSLTMWEPACGDGAMSKVLLQYFDSVYSSDIRVNAGYGVGGIDFLISEKKTDCVVTNPPFDISYEFIEHCHDLKLRIYAMLLKSQYWHSKSRINLFQKTRPSYVLPLTWRPNFAPNRGKSPTMDMLWTVWIDGNCDTQYIQLTKPKIKPTNALF